MRPRAPSISLPVARFREWTLSLFIQNLKNNRHSINDVENPIANLPTSTTVAPRT